MRKIVRPSSRYFRSHDIEFVLSLKNGDTTTAYENKKVTFLYTTCLGEKSFQATAILSVQRFVGQVWHFQRYFVHVS